MTRRRDPDKEAVYYAEEVVFAETLHAEPIHSNDLMYLADQLFSHDWWERYKIPVPTIEPTRATDKSSHAETHGSWFNKSSVIRLAPQSINPWFLAHEAAHIAQFYFYNSTHHPLLEAHGREFRASYLAVTEILLGQRAARDLSASFDRHVRVRRQHKPGKPGSVVTVPKPDPFVTPVRGLFPAWRDEQQVRQLKAIKDRVLIDAPMYTIPRVNGAIAL